MTSSSTPATGFKVARTLILSAVLAVLAGCGGGGGGTTMGAAPSAADPIPTGSTVSAQTTPAATTPQRVNTDTAGQQVLRAVGALSDGGSTVAWLSQSGSAATLQAQRFDARGHRDGKEVGIALDPAQTAVTLAVLPDGGFAVATVRTAPASAAEPWITRTSVTVQRFDAAGTALGQAQELAAIAQDRTGATTLRYVAQPQVRAWDDGGFVVAWAVVTEGSTGKVPQFFAQRFDAAGQAAGAARDLGAGASETTLQLATSPAGGWFAGTASRVMGRTFLNFTGFDGAVAPQLPAGAMGTAEGSLLVPLQDGGTVLLAPTQVYGTLQVYDAAGQARASAGGLRTMPVAAVGLREGGFMLLESIAPGADLAGQRYDGTGGAAGSAFTVGSAGATPQLAALPGGAVTAAWTSTTGGDQDVYAQRVQP